MNKRYDNLWLEIVYLMAEDVITASGGAVTDSNFDDGTQDDIYFIEGAK